MQTETPLKTKATTWRRWLIPALPMVFGTALVYLRTAQWPANDYVDRIAQLLLVLVVFAIAPVAIAGFIVAKIRRRRSSRPSSRQRDL